MEQDMEGLLMANRLKKFMQPILKQKCSEAYQKGIEKGFQLKNLTYESEIECLKVIQKGLQESAPKWIPVTERLPVITEAQQQRIEEISYLLAPEFNVIIKGATKATTLYCDAEGNWFDMDGTCYTVTHWMPLPEPPKEE